MCTAAHSVWYFILPPTFLVEISICLATLARLVQPVWVSLKARVMLKESSAYQSSQIMHLAIDFFIGRFRLNERKKRTSLESRTVHETQWPLDPKESWYFIGKCKPPGS